jgi:hypothetical protein
MRCSYCGRREQKERCEGCGAIIEEPRSKPLGHFCDRCGKPMISKLIPDQFNSIDGRQESEWVCGNLTCFYGCEAAGHPSGGVWFRCKRCGETHS